VLGVECWVLMNSDRKHPTPITHHLSFITQDYNSSPPNT